MSSTVFCTYLLGWVHIHACQNRIPPYHITEFNHNTPRISINILKRGPLQASNTRKKHHRSKKLLYTCVYYTNGGGSCNMTVCYNNNWLNALHSSYIHNTPIPINILSIGPLHASITGKKHIRREAKHYCILGLMLIVEAHATWGHAGRTIIDQLQRHTPDTRYFHETQVSINILKIGPSQSSIIRNKFIYRKYLL